MKTKCARILYNILRYFKSHNKIVIIVSGNSQTRAEITKIVGEIRKDCEDRLYVTNFGKSLIEKIRVLYIVSQAKVLCIQEQKKEALLPDVLNATDIVTYKLVGDTLKFGKNKGKIRQYKFAYNTYEEYNLIINYLINYTAFNCKQNWWNRFLDSLVSGNVVSFLYPTVLVAILNAFFTFINWIVKDIFASIFNYILSFCFYLYPLQKSIVIRSCHHQYNCNPKYLLEAIIADSYFKSWKIYWLVEQNPATQIAAFPPFLTLLKNKSFAAKWHLATAKIVIDNSVLRDIDYISKRQLLIQTWHGSLGIKRFDTAWSSKIALKNDRKTSVCISNSKFETEVFRETYWTDCLIKEFGHARNTILFTGKENLKKAIRKRIGVADDVKIVMFAPTFRDIYRGKTGGERLNKLEPYSVNRLVILRALSNRFGGQWVWLDRFHFHLRKFETFNKSEECSSIINVSTYPDVQELLLISDVLITDYSSIIYDFMLTGRPGLIYATDLEQYQQKERAFFYPIESTPFPISKNEQELIKSILYFDMEKYKERAEKFLKEKGCIDSAYAVSKTLEFIKEKI